MSHIIVVLVVIIVICTCLLFGPYREKPRQDPDAIVTKRTPCTKKVCEKCNDYQGWVERITYKRDPASGYKIASRYYIFTYKDEDGNECDQNHICKCQTCEEKRLDKIRYGPFPYHSALDRSQITHNVKPRDDMYYTVEGKPLGKRY